MHKIGPFNLQMFNFILNEWKSMTEVYKYFFSDVDLNIPIYAKVFRESYGDWVYIGQLSDTLDQANGIGIQVWDSGEIFQGYWKNGVLDGIGITIFKNLDFYIGNFKDDVRQGNGTLITNYELEIQKGYWNKGQCNNKKEKSEIWEQLDQLKASHLPLKEN